MVVVLTAPEPPGTGAPCPTLVVVVGPTVLVVPAGKVDELVAALPAWAVVADAEVVVVVAWAPKGVVVVVVAVVVGTGTTGVGPRPVQTVVVVVEATRCRVVEVLVSALVAGTDVVAGLLSVVVGEAAT